MVPPRGVPMADEPVNVRSTRKNLKVKGVLPPATPVLYSDHTIVACSEEEILVHFCKLQMPIVATQDALDAVDEVDAVCFASIVLTPNRAFGLLRNLSAMLQQWSEAQKPGK